MAEEFLMVTFCVATLSLWSDLGQKMGQQWSILLTCFLSSFHFPLLLLCQMGLLFWCKGQTAACPVKSGTRHRRQLLWFYYTLGALAIRVYSPDFQISCTRSHISGKISQISSKISQISGKISQISGKISQISG